MPLFNWSASPPHLAAASAAGPVRTCGVPLSSAAVAETQTEEFAMQTLSLPQAAVDWLAAEATAAKARAARASAEGQLSALPPPPTPAPPRP